MNAMSVAPLMTPCQALDIVRKFFDSEWHATKPEEVSITRLSGGTLNDLQVIRRTNKSEQEPSAVVIRRYWIANVSEEDLDVIQLSMREETLVSYEMSRNNWGPLLYGIFQGGRLEELISSHPLTPREAADPIISRDIARMYARFASLRLPLASRKIDLFMDDLIEQMEEFVTRKGEIVDKILAIDHPGSGSLAEISFQADWVKEFKWIKSLFQEYDCKPSFCHIDSGFMNILVREGGEPQPECRTMLIDYETSMNGYRGVDIGSHFMERMFSWTDPHDQVSGSGYPTLEEKRSFCQAYLDECIALGHESTDMDTVEKLLTESLVGELFFFARNFVFLIDNPEPVSINSTKLCIHFFHIAKDELLGQG